MEVPRAETLSAENRRWSWLWQLGAELPWVGASSGWGLTASCSFPRSRQNARGRHTRRCLELPSVAPLWSAADQGFLWEVSLEELCPGDRLPGCGPRQVPARGRRARLPAVCAGGPVQWRRRSVPP